MEFLSFDVSSKRLSLEHGPIPSPGPCDLLIKVAFSGICGTDLHILEGTFPCKEDEAFTLGHEFAGMVEAVGSKVRSFVIGDRVSVDPNSGCNHCDYCHGGKYHLCHVGGINNTIGIFRNGGWSSHALVPEGQVHRLPDELSMEQAALSEPLSCLAHGWDRLGPIHVGQRVLVIGAGIIGLLWACLLHLHGLRKTVVVSETLERRRKMARDLGLDYQVSSPQELEGSEFDVIVDCSGSGSAIESAIHLLARGGRFCVFGVANPNAKITIEPYQVYMKELTIAGVNINPFTFPKGIGLLHAMADAYLHYDNLGIKVFELSDYADALQALRNGSISKAVFKM